MINVDDCFATGNSNKPPNMKQPQEGGVRDEEHRGLKPDMPSHEDRLSELHRLGVKVGTEGLTPAQADKLSAILYRARDIMAENVTQVPEARVPRHTIPLNDTKPAIQKRFRYDPAKEQKLESLCDDLLNAGIIKESTSLWNSPVFLTTKADGSSEFLVDFRAVNAKTEPLFCALPSLDEILDQVADCLLYTSPSPRDRQKSRMPSSA